MLLGNVSAKITKRMEKENQNHCEYNSKLFEVFKTRTQLFYQHYRGV